MDSQISGAIVQTYSSEFDDNEVRPMTYIFWKRVLDIIGASLLFLISLPFFILVALAIKIESPGGPIFAKTPKRVGLDGKLFHIYKFRSMIPNAHEVIRFDPEYKDLFEKFKENSFKLDEDPRVTKIGKLIRKYSVDEIPQFINVLKGEMSLVGPRPFFLDELENQQKKYPETPPYVRRSLTVKPGMTGLWQVSGRSAVNFDDRIKIDAEYAAKCSLWLDLKIILKTPFVVFSGKGAC